MQIETQDGILIDDAPSKAGCVIKGCDSRAIVRLTIPHLHRLSMCKIHADAFLLDMKVKGVFP